MINVLHAFNGSGESFKSIHPAVYGYIYGPQICRIVVPGRKKTPGIRAPMMSLLPTAVACTRLPHAARLAHGLIANLSSQNLWGTLTFSITFPFVASWQFVISIISKDTNAKFRPNFKYIFV